MRSKKGFTLLELTVAIGIMTLLFGLMFSIFTSLRESTERSKCMANQRAITMAIKSYCAEYQRFPPDDQPLYESLEAYGVSKSTFICPSDPNPEESQGFSYQKFYIQRTHDTPYDALLIGCPFHESRGVNLFFDGEVKNAELLTVGWRSGQSITLGNGQLQPGDEVSEGTIAFADGSSATLIGQIKVMLIQSFKATGEPPYSLIKVTESENGQIVTYVTPGSKFEVITPAAIVGVQGTKFITTVFKHFGVDVTVIAVYSTSEGPVIATERTGHGTIKLNPGERGTVIEGQEPKKDYSIHPHE